MVKKKKEPNYAFWYILSVVVALITHYFLLSKTDLHPTLQVFIAFLFFAAFMGFSILLLEKRGNK